MKLKISAFHNLIEQRITRKEFILLATCLRCCNEKGFAEGISYRDVADRMSIQGFYDCLYSLKDKQIISYVPVKQDFNITVLNCVFTQKKDYKDGYINLNDKVFYDEDFWRLKVNEQLLLIDLYRICATTGSGKTIGREKFYSKYMKMFQCTARTIKKYIHSLKRFFTFAYKKGMYHIYLLKDSINPVINTTIQKVYDCHYVKMCCRRLRAKAVPEDTLSDMAILISQYRKKKNDIYGAIQEAIKKSLEYCQEILPQYINRILNEVPPEPKKESNKLPHFNGPWSSVNQQNYDFKQLEMDLLGN